MRFSTAWYGTVHFWGGFPLGTVPGTFLVLPRPRFQAIRTITKTWRVNYWSLTGRRKSSLLRHWTCDTRPNIAPLDLNQHSQRRIGSNSLDPLLGNQQKERLYFLNKQQNTHCLVNRKVRSFKAIAFDPWYCTQRKSLQKWAVLNHTAQWKSAIKGHLCPDHDSGLNGYKCRNKICYQKKRTGCI